MRNRPFTIMTLAGLALAGFIPFGARGADSWELEEYVPAIYDLTVYVNVRQALDAEELGFLRERFLNEGVLAFVQVIQQNTGIDLLKDVDAVVIGGKFDKGKKGTNPGAPANPGAGPNAKAGKKKNDSVVLIQGRLDESAVVQFFKMSPQFEEIPMGSKMMYGYWSKDDKEMRYFGFLKAGTFVMGPKDPVERTLLGSENLGEKRLAENAAYLERVKKMNKKALAYVVAVAPPDAPANNPVGEMMLKSAKVFAISVDISNGVRVEANLDTLDSRTARLWREMTVGVLALAQMIEQIPQLGVMARRVVLMNRDASLTASLTMSLDEALELLSNNPQLRKIIKG